MCIPAVGCVTSRENVRSVKLARQLKMEVFAEQQGTRDDGMRTVVALLLRVDRGRWAEEAERATAHP
jgi:hypothetical protein